MTSNLDTTGSNNKKRHTNLSSGLKKVILGKKIAILIDGANLYHSFVNKHKVRLDYLQILNWFSAGSEVEIINYYTAFNPEDTQQENFIKGLEKIGYSVVKKPIKVYGDFTKGNLDIEIAVDAILLQDRYDTLVLFSGDGDFKYLAEKLEQAGKQVISISSGGYTSSELHEQVDHYFFLDRIKDIWQTPKQPTQTTKIKVDTKNGKTIKLKPTLESNIEPVIQVATKTITNISEPIIISDNSDHIEFVQEIVLPKEISKTRIPVKIGNKKITQL